VGAGRNDGSFPSSRLRNSALGLPRRKLALDTVMEKKKDSFLFLFFFICRKRIDPYSKNDENKKERRLPAKKIYGKR